jgi:enoyl-CoA hydratase/carnithine racemase
VDDPRRYDTLEIDRSGGVAWVTISHPPINLLDASLLRDLYALVVELEQVDTASPEGPRVVVLRSADPDFFIAHADLELIRTLPREPQPYPSELGFFHGFVERWRTLPQVTIAQIEGRARGGGSELALSLDLRFGAIGRAVLAQPEVALGIIPGGGGTQRLARLAGRGRALEAVLGCDDFDAETAASYGWVNRALPAEDIGPFVDRLARRIASFPAAALRLAKEAVDAAVAAPFDGLLAEAHAFNQTLTDPALDARFDAALAAGAQTRAGELDLGALLDGAGLGDPPA